VASSSSAARLLGFGNGPVFLLILPLGVVDDVALLVVVDVDMGFFVILV